MNVWESEFSQLVRGPRSGQLLLCVRYMLCLCKLPLVIVEADAFVCHQLETACISIVVFAFVVVCGLLC